MIKLTLPALSPEEEEKRTLCILALRQEMQPSIPFRRYMDIALYHPIAGYYSSKSSIFHSTMDLSREKEGDFYTATRFPLFNQAVAHFIQGFFPNIQHFIEIGPGKGLLTQRLIETFISRVGQPNPPPCFSLIEKSAQLKNLQQQLLRQTPFICRWPEPSDPLALSAEDPPPLFFANELCDAMPVDQILWTGEGWHVLHIAWNETEQSFEEHWHPIEQDPALHACLLSTTLLSRQASLPVGYRTELSLAQEDWLAQLSSQAPPGSWMLLLDYGDNALDRYNPYKHHGSLRCFYQHHLHNHYLLAPGLHDLSADIDFSWLSTRAEAYGWHIEGFSSQTAFLLAQNIQEESDTEPTLQTRHSLHTLLSPTEMGERIKVLLLCKGKPWLTPPPFSVYDSRHQL